MIKFEDVSFFYESEKENIGVHNINLNIKKGEVIVLCGSSGCGKTTITRILNGLIPNYYEGKFNGKLFVKGNEMSNASIYDFVGDIGSVFQNPRSQFFCVEAMDEMAFGCENLLFEEEETFKRIKNSCDDLDINHLMKKNLFRLSGGEKQKIACASVSAINPDIYVLDEPSSNLDIESIEDLRKLILSWKNNGKTIVISEHRLYWLAQIADQFVYLKNGSIDKIFSNKEFLKIKDNKRNEMGLRSLNPFKLDLLKSCKCCKKNINIEGLKFKNKKKTIIDIDPISLPENAIFGILGDNGAGKTSFAKSLCGLEKKTKGTVNLKGKNLNCKKRLKNCYMVMQDVNHQLFTESVFDEVLLSMEGEDEELKKNKVEAILKGLNLYDKKELHPMSLSGGEKQRVAIASAIASDKPIVILDEPTSGLDYKNMNEVSGYIKEMQNSGKSIFIISHDPELLYSCCNHILFIKNGKIMWNNELNKNVANKINKTFFKIHENL